ncbi:cytochrome P450 [Aspergillus affinis]|uniref:cytochrome P450 n=1 Tax=Aspergillus affinis TaxID=1070780 RepID=UPI0022FE7BF7|nr:putative cytochrome P450 [Aspergillus affinis]KAI9035173.1 putative cytochrome P450 [Aspergillus affinis]
METTSSWTDHPRAVWPVVLAIVFQVLAIVAVGLRFYAHSLKRQKVADHDLMIVVALVFSSGLVALLIIATVIGGLGQHTFELSNPLVQGVHFAKVYVANSPVWACAISAVKVSILQLYLSIFRSKPFRYLCLSLITIQTMWCVMVILVSLLLCQPLKLNWDPTAEGHCGSTSASYLCVHIINLLLDVAVGVAPAPELWKLQMKRRRKIELSTLFALGIVICVITIFRITLINELVATDLTYSTTILFFFTILEPLLGIVLASLPMMRPVLQRVTGQSTVSSGSHGLNSSYASSGLKKGRSRRATIRLHSSVDSTAAINESENYDMKGFSQTRASPVWPQESAIRVTNTFDYHTVDERFGTVFACFSSLWIFLSSIVYLPSSPSSSPVAIACPAAMAFVDQPGNLSAWMEHASHPRILTAVAVLLAYLVALSLYRLYISPLAGFPGPKLAAVSGWYETYFEIVKKSGGQFTFEIKRMHERYGPIVRISPKELHIDDPEYYEAIYSANRGLDKSAHVQDRFDAPTAAFSTPSHEVHKRRRGAIAPFFSKRRIYEQAPMIQANVDRICRRLAASYRGTGHPLCLNDMYASFVTDVIMTYAFNRSYHFLDQPGFTSAFTRSIQGLKDFVHYAQQFPWLPRLLNLLPVRLMAMLQPSMEAILLFQEEMRSHVRQVLRNHEAGSDDDQKGTIFYELLNSGLPAEDLAVPRLKDEAMSIVGAGIETTKMANVVTSFHILNNPAILRRLQDELKDAIPDASKPPTLSVLEQLPYLGACIQEGIRLSYGATARSQRLSKHDPLIYHDWVIPPNVMVSLDTYHMHHDERVFPSSHEFKPERWLDGARGPDGEKSLTRYLASFGRGTRMCVGFNLAYAEMTLVLAGLFRNFRFELFETSRRDVDCYRDMVGLEVAPGSRGVRVLVL